MTEASINAGRVAGGDPDDLQLQAGKYPLNLDNAWERCVAVRLFEVHLHPLPMAYIRQSRRM